MKLKLIFSALLIIAAITGCVSKVNDKLPPAPQDSAVGEAYYASFRETAPGKIEALRGSLSILEKLAEKEAVAGPVAVMTIETIRGLDPPAPPSYTFRPGQDMPANQTGVARNAGKGMPTAKESDVTRAVAAHAGASGATGNIASANIDNLAGETSPTGQTGATGSTGVLLNLPGLHGLKG